jgi:acyl-CoA thioester hydrolase/thioesterase-3
MAYKRFESLLHVRPDDIDMNNHVHLSKYLDYYLAARYDQMERCYNMSMEEFVKHGWTWFVKAIHVDYKRQLKLSDVVVVRTWIDGFVGTDVTVGFQILKQAGLKLVADGRCTNTLMSLSTGRSEQIPDWVIQQYTQFVEEHA